MPYVYRDRVTDATELVTQRYRTSGRYCHVFYPADPAWKLAESDTADVALRTHLILLRGHLYFEGVRPRWNKETIDADRRPTA
jgi:hypothetical protein